MSCSPLAHFCGEVQGNTVEIDLSGGEQMADSIGPVLALIPHEMQLKMRDLRRAVAGTLTICGNADDFAQHSRERIYAVALVPASLPTQEWWSLWGLLSTMEPQPSILVYTLSSDFPMWSGVLEAGGFDVLVAPFTKAKLRTAVESAAKYFHQRPTR
jgi:FixJ family two-component response regulator